MSNDSRKNEGRDAPRTGSVVPKDPDLVTWLHALWHRGEPPERIEMFQVSGRNKLDRGRMIFHEDFKPADKLDQERCTRLANELLAVAQNDTDAVGRKSYFEISVIDRYRTVGSLVRLVGPVSPQRTYLIKEGDSGHSPEDDDDEFQLSGRNLGLAYTRENYEQVRWEKQNIGRVIGDMMVFQRDTIAEQRGWIAQMMEQQITFFHRLQEAEDRKLDRDIRRKKEDMTLELMKEGLRMGRTLVAGFFGQPSAEQAAAPDQSGSQEAAEKDYGHSPERMLVDGFLDDCESAGIAVELFGDWEEKDNKLTQVKEGIFTAKQFAILLGVKTGRLPADALDALIPEFGSPHALTPEQLIRAQGVKGMKDTIGAALLEVRALRLRRKELKTSSAEKPAS